jgi:hypothetical protein
MKIGRANGGGRERRDWGTRKWALTDCNGVMALLFRYVFPLFHED